MTLKPILLALVVVAVLPAWGQDFIAGSTPFQRPANAPTIKEHHMNPEILGQRLHGVADPLPVNVVNAAMAGAWFMPLARAGMTPPYDIRGWHLKNSSSSHTQ